MKCVVCGREFQPQWHGGKAAKYCSPACRAKAYRMRRKKRQESPDRHADRHDEHAANLSKSQFDVMMTQSTDEALAFVAQKLEHAIGDDMTPATALPSLAKEYLDVIREIDDRARKTADSAPTGSIDAPVDMENI